MRKARNLPLILGCLILLVFVFAALWPSLLTPYGQKDIFASWEKPSVPHPLGTNALGYDVLAELVYGTRDTLLIGLVSSVLTLLFGLVIGVLAAQNGPVGAFFNGLINLFVLLPRLVSLIVLSAFLGNGMGTLILLIALFGWAPTARAVRERVRHLMVQPFMEALRIQGLGTGEIALRHVLPNLGDILLTRFLLGVNSCIMMESTLSFLGFGDLYHPTWGTMINLAYRRGAFLRSAYGYLLMPGLCIVVLSLAFYLISLWISQRRDILSPGSAA